MKLKINKSQFQLLTNNFVIIEGKGIQSNNNLLTEARMREYLVTVIINGLYAQLRVGAHNGTNALMIVRKLFPQARPTGKFISA